MPAQLYYTPTSCGAASFISAYKGGILGTKLHASEVDIRAHKILTGPKAGESFYDVNYKGNVPTLVLEDGTVLNENAAVLQWIADNSDPAAKLAPANGTTERYVLQAKLSVIGTEVHKAVGALFNPTLTPELKEFFLKGAHAKLEQISKQEIPAGTKFYVGDNFTVADAYLYIVLSWSGYLGIDLSKFPSLQAYFDGIKALPFVQEAHKTIAEASPTA